MIKTLKGKVITGVMAVGLLSSAGVAFGASDAGANLKAWYDGQFGKASAGINTDAEAYVDSLGLDVEYNNLKENATTKINNEVNASDEKSSTTINAKKKEHIDAIKGKKLEIEGYMAGEFTKLLTDAEKVIFDAGTKAARDADKDMGIHTGVKGQEALANLNTKLAATTSSALDELEQAIANAKSDLQTQLDTQSTATTGAIKGLIDTRVGEVRNWVTFMTNFMVQEQEDLIKEEALRLENAAKDAMNSLVDGI